ncbi:MAG: SufB/SufD family protein, partial [Oceanobacter sp.]
MNKFQQDQIQRVSQQSAPEWLTSVREAGASAFTEAPWPTRKTEAFKYCSLKALGEVGFDAAAPALEDVADVAIAAAIPGLDTYRLVLVNGVLDEAQSDAQALDQVVRFSQANAEQQALISQYLGKVNPAGANQHLFNSLNDAALSDGFLIHIERNQKLDKPLQICSLSTSAEAGFSINQRVLVVLETSAELTLIEQYSSLSDEKDSSFTNALTEVNVGDNARLNHYRLQLMQEDALHIGSSWVNLQRDANYDAFHLGLGSEITRNDLVVRHSVGGSHAEIAGVYVPKNSQLVDFHTDIEHEAAHCTSNEVFRGIINDQAKAVFNGRIHIHKDAQKTLAELSNKNLLLTNKAEINTKPELEIYA